MKTQLLTGAAALALITPAAAFAQSTGTIAAENEDTIVVTGTRTQPGVQGVEVPQTPRVRTVLDNSLLSTLAPGQTLAQAINLVPSTNFTNNDPFGISGGNVRIRGFDGARVSFTWDGLPLNDTGNYAIYTNQTLDPELIDQVNVNQGTTDIDSPTAASSGGTINYRTIIPQQTLGGMVSGSVGESYANRQYGRVFAMLQTGDILGTGVRGFFATSKATADKYRGFGQLSREQYNARLYKVINEGNGDFISIAGHYNRNRNASFRALTLAQAAYNYATTGRFTYDNNGFCARPTPNGATPQNENNTPQGNYTVIPTNLNSTYINGGLPGANFAVAGQDTNCMNYYGVRINPSNTGNVRFNSKFTLADNVVFTLDAGYQYTLANGGGFTTLAENAPLTRGTALAGSPNAGVDFNGDGTIGNFGSVVNGVFVPARPNAAGTNFVPDQSAFYAPNTTNTNRYTVLSSLRWDFDPSQYVRLAYAYDFGRHRQTGEWTFLDAIGNPINVFGGRTAAQRVYNADGYFLRQRDRFSRAELNQISGEYRGKFLDNRLEVQLGGRLPFFFRELNQYCYTLVTSGNPTCTSQTFGTTPAANTTYIVPANYTPPATGLVGTPVYAPFTSRYKYKKFLPNIGFTFSQGGGQLYFNYAKGLSAPRTDNLYRAPLVGVQPETTDNFDLGVRYTSNMVQATLGGFYNRFQNRIVTSFDQNQGISVDRNVGRVVIKGAEATLNVRPFPWFSFYGFGSYIDARLKDNIALGTVATPLPGIPVGSPVFALTAGKRLVETPSWQYGYRAVLTAGPASFGFNFKHVSSRFATDINDVKLPGYSTFDVDARLSLAQFGLKQTFFQLNVQNLFDRQYLGSYNTQISVAGNPAGLVVANGVPVPVSFGYGGANPTFQPGAPRTVVASIRVGF